jgi:hypothetical protein
MLHHNEKWTTTDADAQRWILQEAAKHPTIESRNERIRNEASMIRFCTEMNNAYGLSMHQGLVDVLKAANEGASA